LRRPPLGTTFSFSLNTPSAVLLRFTQIVAGRRLGRRCLAQSPRDRRHRRCTLTLTRGTLTFTAAHAGRNRVAFQGALSRTWKLAPGRYTLMITAANSSGTSPPQRISFAIVHG